jgi:cation diffusion facilitator family transporter
VAEAYTFHSIDDQPSGRRASPYGSMMETGKFIGLGILSVGINVVLMLIKIITGVLGNSYALIADGIESAGDIFTSLLTWTGFQLSLRPYGHGKIESLAGLLSGISLLLAAAFIAFHSIEEIVTPHRSPAWFTLPVLIGVVIFKEALSRRILLLGDSLESRALQGDAWHHRSDAITSAAVAIGISIALFGGKGYEIADDCAALIACAIIVANGIRIMKHSLHDFMDGCVGKELEEAVTSLPPASRGLLSSRNAA